MSPEFRGVTMKMVLIRPGKFLMGSPDSEQDRYARECPQHAVTISNPFYLGATEVTQAQYQAVMGTNPSHFRGPTNPVETVSWYDAAEFCKKLAEKTGQPVRLPTEAEWEYASRAGSKTRFCSGDSDDELAKYAWHWGNSEWKPHPVGRKKPNAWGLYDMHGNVEEWCADWYGEYPKGPATDPSGPASGYARVVRGGSFFYVGTGPFRCADRGSPAPAARNYTLGFRCARTLP
jgi:formylglycine-generating enzyme required for sulfatase activity